MKKILAVIVLMAAAAPALADGGTVVRWNSIVGRQGQEADSQYMTVGPYVPGNWMWVESGSVTLNLETGRVKIEVRHLSVASNNPGFLFPLGGVLGDPNRPRAGKFVCDALGKAGDPVAVETDPFQLDESGSVTFRGFITVPQSCRDAPDQIAFLLGGAQARTYFAFGVGRVVLNDAD